MTEANRPEGQFFSRTYLDEGDPTQDSERMRLRLAHLVHSLLGDGKSGNNSYSFSKSIEWTLGIRGPHSTTGYAVDVAEAWITYFTRIDVSDLLDVVTLAVQDQTVRRRHNPATIPSIVQLVFDETKVAYEMDPKGGVHPRIDQGFTMQRASAIAGLNAPEHEPARNYIEQCMAALGETPPDGAEAIRDLFLAAENIFKRMFPSANSLNQHSIQANLKPLVGSQTDAKYLEKMCSGFTEWVNVAHNFRHEQSGAVVNQPSDELRTLLVSQGFSFIRWLASLHNASKQG